jgi:hypothetical protein
MEELLKKALHQKEDLVILTNVLIKMKIFALNI